MDKISAFEAMACRLPKESDFEEYWKRAVRPRGAYRDERHEPLCVSLKDSGKGRGRRPKRTKPWLKRVELIRKGEGEERRPLGTSPSGSKSDRRFGR